MRLIDEVIVVLRKKFSYLNLETGPNLSYCVLRLPFENIFWPRGFDSGHSNVRRKSLHSNN